MPRRISNRPTDVNQAAHLMVERTTADQSTPTKSEISRVMAEMGRRGGKKGGKRRLETMSPEKRREIAFKAAQARWKNKKKH
jgi:glucan biosynthesis protein